MLSKPKRNINICGRSDVLSCSTKIISKINQQINDLLIIHDFVFSGPAILTPKMTSELPFFSKISPILLANIHLGDRAFSMLEFPVLDAYKK